MRRFFTRGDILLIVILTLVSAGSIAFTNVLARGGKHAVVEVDGKRVLELPLDQDVHTTVTGPLGETYIEIHDGAVGITDSPCPHKYCMHMGMIRSMGELVVCVPNRVVISIVNGDESEALDGVTQ